MLAMVAAKEHMMKITTESGTVYNIDDGIATIEGNNQFSVKIINNFCFDTTAIGDMTLDEVISNEQFHLPLQIGKRMIVNGIWEWRISTPIISIE